MISLAIMSSCLGIELLKHFSDPFQFLANGDKQFMVFSVRSLSNQFQFHLVILYSFQISNLLLRSRDGKPLFVEKFLNLQDELQILFSVKPLERSSFMGFDDFKFRFPVAEHMGFEACNSAHLSDPVIEPIIGNRILILPTFE